MFRNEKEIAYRAELMLTQALQEKMGGFAEHLRGEETDESMREASAVATVKKYGKAQNGNEQFFLRKLSIKMPRHGFVQHFGISTTRSGGTRTRKNPRNFTYSYRSHPMDMEGHPFINDAVDSSGVVDFVMNEVCKLRSEEIFASVRRIMENRTST